ncbi:hypothetical protein L6164_004116 [Bauhinia variegata]|uniref:Uncharacterized protein n=1 Tax=Bauhinia variegata TaxID=167791 RepID=A0ACB9Q2J2_BAUVA|nr:hypothetical protein L6164_004116 [Bauhinia variegata]
MDSPGEILENMPLGFRFRPTDEELVNHYLKLKVLGDNSRVRIIREVDICKFEPWDLPALSEVKSDDPEWFFFSPRDLKYSNSNRANRTTKAGFWKATGKDRNVKIRGTNNVIGTKKTLVFYKGRVPHGVKTNWIIHEYHATIFPVDQRTYVLCRLMNKHEKKTDEGPSSHMASDYENQAIADQFPEVNSLEEVNLESIFPEPAQAEVYPFDSLQQSPVVSEQERTFPFYLPDTTEEEDNAFLNAIIADEDVFYTEQRSHAFVTDYTPSKPLRKVYYESSDTEAEVISARSSKMVKSSHYGTVHAGSQLISNQQVNSMQKDIMQDDFWGVGTSSADSTKDGHLSINCISIVSSPSPPRRHKPQDHPKSSQKASARRQTQRKVSSKEMSKNEAEKEISILQTKKDQGKTQGSNFRKKSETTSIQSSEVDRKGSFIYWETQSSLNLNPHSVYLVNVVVGFCLLIVTVWDLISSRN